MTLNIREGPFDKTYNSHWGYLDYNGKVVLDLGCDWGSSCYYFLDKGAKLVIGVDYNSSYIEKGLKEKANNAILIELMIDSPIKIEELINEYNPDVVKVDIEGAEKYILDMDPNIIVKVKEWIIEIHRKKFEPNNIVTDKSLFIKLFSELGYEVIDCKFVVPVYLFRRLDK